MPNGILGNISVAQAWNQSEFDKARENEAEQARQLQALAQMRQEAPAAPPVTQDTPARITDLLPAAAQQAAPVQRPLTAQEYKNGVTSYLMNVKGYKYEDALRLMAPDIAAYEQQEKADNERKAFEVAAQLDNMPIDSPDYRANALRLLKLNPQMGQVYLKDSIGRRDIWNRQQKKEDMQYNADFQMQNMLKRMALQKEFARQQALEKVQQLMSAGLDEKSAVAAVLGVGNRVGRGGLLGGAAANAMSASDAKGLKSYIDTLNEEATNIETSGGKVPDELKSRILHFQKMYDGYFNNKYGYQNWQQRVDDLIRKNGGIDENLVKALRTSNGLKPDDENPEHPINQYLAARGYKTAQRRTVRE